jgi:hypothetical protein
MISLDAMPIPLRGGKRGYAWVSPEDYEAAKACVWNITTKRARNKRLYAMGNENAGRGQGTNYLHRFIAERMGLDLSGKEIDHIDHDGLNCTRGNLRTATHRQNMANRPPRADNKTGYKGVSRTTYGIYVATVVMPCGTQKVVAYESCPESAARIRDMWASEAYGEFAWLNFP